MKLLLIIAVVLVLFVAAAILFISLSSSKRKATPYTTAQAYNRNTTSPGENNFSGMDAGHFKFCNKCGTKNPIGQKFCGNCGAVLSNNAQQSQNYQQ